MAPKIQTIAAAILLSFFCTSSALSAGTGSGYAWANSPGEKRYQPNKSYAFNSSRGAIRIQRRSRGTYRVNFAGLGGKGRAGGHVQVTAYGGRNEYCKVQSWNSKGADFIVNVGCFGTNGKPADSQYTVSVAWPPESRFKLLDPAAGNSGGSIERTIKANGNVELRYPDGRVEELFQGGKNITLADGTSQRLIYSTQAPVAIPPSVPDQSEFAWLNDHSEGLLGIIRILVDNDEGALQSYMQFETPGASLYEKIAKRRRTVGFLVTP